MILKELNKLLESPYANADGKLTRGYGIICAETDQVNGRDADLIEVYLDEVKFCRRIGTLIEESVDDIDITKLHADPEIQAKLQAQTGKKRYRDMTWDELVEIDGWDDFSGSCIILHKF